MAKIVNLRTRRKQNARDAARTAGDESAAKHGRSAAEMSLSKARTEKERRDLDAHQRGPDQRETETPD